MSDNMPMLTVSLRELHRNTGKFVHLAATEPVRVTERGRVIARLGPDKVKAPKKSYALPDREEFIRSLPYSPVDSADLVSEDREDRF